MSFDARAGRWGLHPGMGRQSTEVCCSVSCVTGPWNFPPWASVRTRCGTHLSAVAPERQRAKVLVHPLPSLVCRGPPGICAEPEKLCWKPPVTEMQEPSATGGRIRIPSRQWHIQGREGNERKDLEESMWAFTEPFRDGICPSIWIGMNLEVDTRASK